jgi:alkylresorcinol/alkylpyrone synthase
MKNIIIANFQPILVGKLIDQTKLNQYTKFLYHHFQKQDANQLVTADGEIEEESISFETVSSHVDKYAVTSENIKTRQILIYEGVQHFIENEMMQTNPSDYHFPIDFEVKEGNFYGPKIQVRMEWYKRKMRYVFNKFYSETLSKPENIIHVTCSGYSSPSLAQEAVIKRHWDTVQVTHSYHMGCYGAFPAIRTGTGLLNSSSENGRVDIIHTELLSAHLNLTEFSPSNTMICSLFADGFIGYSLYEQNNLMQDESIKNKNGLKILSFHEVIIPDSLEDMSWDLGEYNFLMTLSKRVPVFIRKNIKNFVITLCQKANVDLSIEKDTMHFAIHPGGPKIIDYVVDELELNKSQANWSYHILFEQGNMSSATIPHIFNKIVNDPDIKQGTKIVAMAFGPGLTATGLLLEKYK